MSSAIQLLLIHCSPRAGASNSRQLADYFVSQLVAKAGSSNLVIDQLDLCEEHLPDMGECAVSAKYAVLENEALSGKQSAIWQNIEGHIERFCSADVVIIALPVWNFGVPYRLKHYIDVITQPRSVFTWTPTVGYHSLLKEKPALVFSSSASDFAEGSGNEQDDFCNAYLKRWLQVYMNCSVQVVSDAPTVHDPSVVESARNLALKNIEQLADSVSAMLVLAQTNYLSR